MASSGSDSIKRVNGVDLGRAVLAIVEETGMYKFGWVLAERMTRKLASERKSWSHSRSSAFTAATNERDSRTI
jgi:hypothetical protein